MIVAQQVLPVLLIRQQPGHVLDGAQRLEKKVPLREC
jgi:hypothetical protein